VVAVVAVAVVAAVVEYMLGCNIVLKQFQHQDDIRIEDTF
jgi:sensor domain CHASE-containing protein